MRKIKNIFYQKKFKLWIKQSHRNLCLVLFFVESQIECGISQNSNPYYYFSQLDVYPDNTGRRQSYSNSFIKVNEKSLDQHFFVKNNF